MGYTASGGPDGLGVFNSTPTTVSDLNKLLEIASNVGNVRKGTATERAALSGAQLFEGLLWSETDTGQLWRYDGTAWGVFFRPGVTAYAQAAGQVDFTGMTSNVVKSTAVTFPAGRFTASPIVALSCQTASPTLVAASTDGPSASGVTIYGVRTDSTSTLTVRWTAIQMTPTTGNG